MKIKFNTPLKKASVSNNANPQYSKRSLRKQFYISLIANIIFVIIFFTFKSNCLKAISFVAIFWCTFFMYCAFECSLDSFDDISSNGSK